MNTLLVIDGNAILHRAFHALPPMNGPEGQPVNAVYGFATILLRLLSDLKPSHVVVAFDRPAPTFRKKLLETYQAHRPKMDDGLSSQVPIVHDMVSAFGIPIYEMDGFEADDVIGTISMQAVSSGDAQSVIIVTGDRDLLQLVDGKIMTFMPTKGLSEGKLYGVAEARDRLGVDPDKIPDYKALAGDQSDNYPGVPGIGPKTAQSLVASFGSVEAVYEAIDTKDPRIAGISRSILEKLTAGRESAMLSKNLATIRRDVPVSLDFASCTASAPGRPEAVAFFEKLHFRTLIQRLTGNEAPVTKKAETKKPAPENDSEQLTLV